MDIFKYIQINDNFWKASSRRETEPHTRNLEKVSVTHTTKKGLVVRMYQEGLLIRKVSTQMEKVDKHTEKCFREEETRFSNKLTQRSSASFTIREMPKHNEIPFCIHWTSRN